MSGIKVKRRIRSRMEKKEKKRRRAKVYLYKTGNRRDTRVHHNNGRRPTGYPNTRDYLIYGEA